MVHHMYIALDPVDGAAEASYKPRTRTLDLGVSVLAPLEVGLLLSLLVSRGCRTLLLYCIGTMSLLLLFSIYDEIII